MFTETRYLNKREAEEIEVKRNEAQQNDPLWTNRMRGRKNREREEGEGEGEGKGGIDDNKRFAKKKK